ncbi:hypothetical protein HGO38_26065 [Rhizobium sp. CG5]|uniref:hypothetical protein n=1 Tax=Rhizobium sp. CG5 TaxID=2726076 RepID=UPI0020345F24|nr:hypothetical protein [Rhizobium sp. CG5]MCM2476919.1 hypothetical protein [Rhizobium sp. CG5]
MAGLIGVIAARNATAQTPQQAFPPVPSWRPSFSQPLDRVIDRISYYTNGRRDFAVFRNGTCVLLHDGLADQEATEFSLNALSGILNYHPDVDPSPMDDGNVLVRYNQPAVNVVLHDIAEAHWSEIEDRHLDGLTPDEVVITPLGPNTFDTFGKQVLLGRTYMFMDALKPEIAEIRRVR